MTYEEYYELDRKEREYKEMLEEKKKDRMRVLFYIRNTIRWSIPTAIIGTIVLFSTSNMMFLLLMLVPAIITLIVVACLADEHSLPKFDNYYRKKSMAIRERDRFTELKKDAKRRALLIEQYNEEQKLKAIEAERKEAFDKELSVVPKK